MRENRKHITRVSSDEARHLKGETDYARLDAMTDDDIARAVADDPDAPPLDIDWTKARLVLPPGKDVITLRLDRDVLDWFRSQGKGYQTRINQVLRAFYEARRNPLAAKADAVEELAGLVEGRSKASGGGLNARLERAPRGAGPRANEQRQASLKKAIFEILPGRARITRTMWPRRAQEYETKINSGDISAIAEVVRDLYRSDAQPEQSYSKRQLYQAALDRLVREIAAVVKSNEIDVLKAVEAQLQESQGRAAHAKQAAKATVAKRRA